jgi:hypothetical protein
MTSPDPRQLPRNFAQGLALSAPPGCGMSEAAARPAANASRLKTLRPEKTMLEFDNESSPKCRR